jgi:hypothetical protein
MMPAKKDPLMTKIQKNLEEVRKSISSKTHLKVKKIKIKSIKPVSSQTPEVIVDEMMNLYEKVTIGKAKKYLPKHSELKSRMKDFVSAHDYQVYLEWTIVYPAELYGSITNKKTVKRPPRKSQTLIQQSVMLFDKKKGRVKFDSFASFILLPSKVETIPPKKRVTRNSPETIHSVERTISFKEPLIWWEEVITKTFHYKASVQYDSPCIYAGDLNTPHEFAFTVNFKSWCVDNPDHLGFCLGGNLFGIIGEGGSLPSAILSGLIGSAYKASVWLEPDCDRFVNGEIDYYDNNDGELSISFGVDYYGSFAISYSHKSNRWAAISSPDNEGNRLNIYHTPKHDLGYLRGVYYFSGNHFEFKASVLTQGIANADSPEKGIIHCKIPAKYGYQEWTLSPWKDVRSFPDFEFDIEYYRLDHAKTPSITITPATASSVDVGETITFTVKIKNQSEIIGIEEAHLFLDTDSLGDHLDPESQTGIQIAYPDNEETHLGIGQEVSYTFVLRGVKFGTVWPFFHLQYKYSNPARDQQFDTYGYCQGVMINDPSKSVGYLCGSTNNVDTGMKVADAEILLTSEDKQYSITSDGHFTLENLPPATYRIQSNQKGYLEKTREIQIEQGKVTNVDIPMISLDRVKQAKKPSLTITPADTPTKYCQITAGDTIAISVKVKNEDAAIGIEEAKLSILARSLGGFLECESPIEIPIATISNQLDPGKTRTRTFTLKGMKLGTAWPRFKLSYKYGKDAEFTTFGTCEEILVNDPAAAVGYISGTTLYSDTKTNCSDAEVVLKSVKNEFSITSDGCFALADIPPDIYRIQASSPGYLSDKTEINIRKGRVTKIDLLLNALPIVGNKNTKELHVRECMWAKRIKRENKIYFEKLQAGLKAGYDGCYYCLGKYHTR